MKLKDYIFIIVLALLTGCEVATEGIAPGTYTIDIIREDANTTIIDDIDTEIKKSMAIPAYFYDSSLWKKVLNVDGEMVVVVNPDNGVGDGEDSHYSEIINSLVNGSKKPIGYISSDYTQKSLEDMKNSVDKWIQFYPDIKGFFIDEVSLNNFDYYKDLSEYIKSKGDYYLMLNPGALPKEEYLAIADNIIIYDRTHGRYKFQPNICQNWGR